jgi:hypothetical protein
MEKYPCYDGIRDDDMMSLIRKKLEAFFRMEIYKHHQHFHITTSPFIEWLMYVALNETKMYPRFSTLPLVLVITVL